MQGKFLLFVLLALFGISEFAEASPAGVVLHGRILDSKTLQPVAGSVSIYLDSDFFKKNGP